MLNFHNQITKNSTEWLFILDRTIKELAGNDMKALICEKEKLRLYD